METGRDSDLIKWEKSCLFKDSRKWPLEISDFFTRYFENTEFLVFILMFPGVIITPILKPTLFRKKKCMPFKTALIVF